MLEILEGDILECIGPLAIPLAMLAGTVVKSAADAWSANKASSANKKINEAALDQERYIAEQNFARQDEAFRYQQQLNDLTMSREDNAVQRRVEDLKRAGLNPVLAAGDAANSASFRAGSAPQMDSSYIGNYASRTMENNRLKFENQMAVNRLKLDLVSQAVDISRTAAETEVMRERAADLREKRPSSVENMELANAFLRQTFDTRVERELVGLSRDRKLEIYQGLQNRLAEKEIDYQDVKYLMGYAEYLYRQKGMDKIDQEILVMNALIKARDLEIQEREWNLNYYKERGLPTNWQDPKEIKIINEILKDIGFDPSKPAVTKPNGDVNIPGIKPFNIFGEYPADSAPFEVPDYLLQEIEAEEFNYKERQKEKQNKKEGKNTGGATRAF